MIRLTNTSPKLEGSEICFDTFPVVLGRGSRCDVSVPVEFISRRHCRFLRRGDEYLVQDLESRNGTFVNGQRADYLTPVHHGDELQLGPITFRVAIQADPDPSTLLMGQGEPPAAESSARRQSWPTL
jgi:pSer/pThr/pTyr-binding forkhead associated (FHA) protein